MKFVTFILFFLAFSVSLCRRHQSRHRSHMREPSQNRFYQFVVGLATALLNVDEKAFNGCVPEEWQIVSTADELNKSPETRAGKLFNWVLTGINIFCKFRSPVEGFLKKAFGRRRALLQRFHRLPGTKLKNIANKVKVPGTKLKNIANKVKVPGTKPKTTGGKVTAPGNKLKATANKVKAMKDNVKDALTPEAIKAAQQLKNLIQMFKTLLENPKVKQALSCAKAVGRAGYSIYQIVMKAIERAGLGAATMGAALVTVFLDLLCNADLFAKSIKALILAINSSGEPLKRYKLFGEFIGSLLRAFSTR